MKTNNTESNQPTHESPLVVIADNVEDLFQESIAASILTVMCNLQELIDNINWQQELTGLLTPLILYI